MSIKALEAAVAKLENLRLSVTEQLAEARAEIAVAELANANGHDDGHGDGANSSADYEGTNPFVKLIGKDGRRDPAVEKQIASLILRVGPKKATQIARSGNRTLGGQPLE